MSEMKWESKVEIERRAMVICRNRDPNSAVCSDGPCPLCLDEAKREYLRELTEWIADINDPANDHVRLLSAEKAAVEMFLHGRKP